MEYKLINQVFNDSQFCDTCAMVNPNAMQHVSTSIVYSTGCKAVICIADLKIKSSFNGSRYALFKTIFN